ncbi:hypothetical protein D9756_003997 [Leucocoprinus leucothites]|uniref:RING-type E3 ubiquitin transferase n=1 Tax=Leucocoprinus leucothites TaxID=201217 RepID=A0A8H5G0N5_9AGAR|nr:hypothetical protein D9756_003997 [Leucoagaricus leucothites]
MAGLLSFPRAQQAQIIRANQRDIYHVSSLREQTENVLRSWLGTRWLTRWDREVDLLTKLVYYGITIGRGNQSLGEEYTDIWQYTSFTSRTPPSARIRGLLIVLSTFPSYFLSKWAASPILNMRHPKTAKFMKTLPSLISVATEVNLAVFYLKGTYYDLSKRILGVHHNWREETSTMTGKRKQRADRRDAAAELFIDEKPVVDFLDLDLANEPAKPAEEDERTILDRSGQIVVLQNVAIFSAGIAL